MLKTHTHKSLSIFLVFAILFLTNNALSNIEVSIEKYINNTQQVGTGTLSFLIWDAYDATLIAPNGKYNKKQPFALNLKYRMSFTSNEIASRSKIEIKKLGYNNYAKLNQWEHKMREAFPDVQDGSTLVGIAKEGKSIFYFNDKKTAEIDDAEFTKYFFDIWLSDETSEPRLRKKLLGKI